MNQFDMSKLSSGKFILTVIAAFVFAYCAVRSIIPPDKTYDIISIIVVAYFMKGQNNPPKGV
jgi:hypothetical protein